MTPNTIAAAVALAIVLSASFASASTCSVEGGTCKDVSKCASTTVSGLCPGASNIRCCYPGQGKACSVAGKGSGKCLVQGRQACSGTFYSGACNGPAKVKCCVTKSAPTPTPTPTPPSTSGVPAVGVSLIKECEGLHKKIGGNKVKAYPDPLSGGRPYTIGYGSTKKKNGQNFNLGDVITYKEAEDLLIYQLKRSYLPKLTKIPHWNEMSDNQKGALLSFAYNLGASFYGNSRFATITRRLKNKEWSQVPSALYLYRNPGTSVEKALGKRRKAEGSLWRGKRIPCYA